MVGQMYWKTKAFIGWSDFIECALTLYMRKYKKYPACIRCHKDSKSAIEKIVDGTGIRVEVGRNNIASVLLTEEKEMKDERES